MGEVIVFPDATALVITGLRNDFTARGETAQVAARVPGARSFGAGPLVLVRRVGGETRDVVLQDAGLTVEAWADEAEDAHDLCQLAVGVIRSLAGTVVDAVPVYRVADVEGPAFLPDPESEQPRYTATLSVTVRGGRLDP